MLNQLVEFGKARRGEEANDALKKEKIGIIISIDKDGNYKSMIPVENRITDAEVINRTSGKIARLLLDTVEYTLGLVNVKPTDKDYTKAIKSSSEKHKLYLEKIQSVKHIEELKPVFAFYESNITGGINKITQEIFEESLKPQERKGNIAFHVLDSNCFVNEYDSVKNFVISSSEIATNSSFNKCSICGETNNPISEVLHLVIPGIPPQNEDQRGGKILVSYNASAYESYGFEKNENSSICSACARNYVEGLKFLLNDGVAVTREDGKGKKYETFNYHHRKKLGSDTALVFWTKSGDEIKELNYLEDPEDFRIMIDTAVKGKANIVKKLDTDRFYSLILSGASSRIAIRNWIETSTNEVKKNIIEWFEDIRLNVFDYEAKEIKPVYYPIHRLSESLAVHKKDSRGDYKPDYEDAFIGRSADYLWRAALLNKPVPGFLLDRVLRRIRMEQGNVKPQRVALIKLILNRGGFNMKEKCDFENMNPAYISGRIFAVLENIQSAALGDNLNAPIKDRFFSSASTNPSSAFGRLFKMSNNHLSKLRGDKPGYAVNLEKKLGELVSHITEFPVIFTLEEQGQFAIGYYHQRQENFTKKENSKGEGNE